MSLVTYLFWRVNYTIPVGGGNRAAALALLCFEALPLAGLVTKLIMLWNIDGEAPPVSSALAARSRVVVLIPTYNEPAEVIAPTVAAACALQPSHDTWVLDDGDRAWVAEMCAVYGARYVCRPSHEHAKAGNLNYALDLLGVEDASGAGGADIIAVLDCDHVPLPTFLTATMGWFLDESIAIVQGPQAFYNAGAFDDDGFAGEQGVFFNVLMPSRHHGRADPIWCGSTSLLRVRALREVGGVAVDTITEDMHTTVKLIRAGWRTVYHHQTLAVGLAPSTADQYLLQRRRWGMGAMQILVHERLWAANKWMSWRTYYEYLSGALWWLEGIATLMAFAVPIGVMVSGAETSTADPIPFACAFVAMFTARLWGAKRLLRNEIHWPTAFALRVFRIPVGMACVWWVLTRQTLHFEVTPKAGTHERLRGRAPKILWSLTAVVATTIIYALAGLARWVPWHTSVGSTIASGIWLVIAGFVLAAGTRRISAPEFATTRRNAHRFSVTTPIVVDNTIGELVDISVGGAAVRFPHGTLPKAGLVQLELPGAQPIKMEIVTTQHQTTDHDLTSLRADLGDWVAYREMSLWIFHTPPGAQTGLPAATPIAASTKQT